MRKRARTAPKSEPTEEDDTKLDLGLGGIFKGLGSFIELVGELAEQGKTEITREGELKRGRTRAVYGFTVKVGAGGVPEVERFGNVRQTEKGAVVEEVREPVVEVFDEGDEIIVICELPGVEEQEIELDLKGDILLISTSKGERKYSKEVLLPCVVNQDTPVSSYRNGVLEIRIKKTTGAGD